MIINYLGWIDNGFNPTVRSEKEQIKLTGDEKKPDCRKDPQTGEYYFDFHIFVNEVDRGIVRFQKLWRFFSTKNATFPIIVAFISKMAHFKN